jgi:NodT family efflux transporter outer membrane factor (OMF) lipoprotein
MLDTSLPSRQKRTLIRFTETSMSHITKRLILVALLGSALGACAPQMSLPEQQVALPAAWPLPTVGKATELARGDWWRALNDPLLDQIIDAALKDNPSLQQTLTRVEASRALITRARADGLPQLDAAGQGQFSRRLDGTSAGRDTVGQFSAGPSVSWELDVFGRVRNSVRGARADADTSEYRASAAKVLLVSDIVQAYVDLRVAQQRLLLIDQSVQTQSKLVGLIATREKAGLSSDFELNRAKTNLGQTLSERPASQQQAEVALQRLATLAGKAQPDETWATIAMLPSLDTITIDQAPADILRLRPDVRAAESQVMRASADVGVAISELYPRLTIGGQISVSDNLIGAVLPGQSILSSLTPSISMPLFNWGARQATVKARQAQLKEAIYGYRDSVLNAYAEAQNSMVAVSRQTERQKNLADAQVSAAKALSQAELLYTRGLTGLTERLDAETQALNTQLSLLGARQSTASAIISLHKALSPAEPVVIPK